MTSCSGSGSERVLCPARSAQEASRRDYCQLGGVARLDCRPRSAGPRSRVRPPCAAYQASELRRSVHKRHRCHPCAAHFFTVERSSKRKRPFAIPAHGGYPAVARAMPRSQACGRQMRGALESSRPCLQFGVLGTPGPPLLANCLVYPNRDMPQKSVSFPVGRKPLFSTMAFMLVDLFQATVPISFPVYLPLCIRSSSPLAALLFRCEHPLKKGIGRVAGPDELQKWHA
jgi:hypothetical protein